METPYGNSPLPASGQNNSAAIAKNLKTMNQVGCESRKKITTKSAAALTGCLSKVSAIEPHEHAYFDALKDYAAHYSEAQDYLGADAGLIARDYTLLDGLLNESDQALSQSEEESAPAVQVSDEDIANCGYLGWLRH